MRVNEYKELKDFIYEYESGRSIPADNLDRQKFMGIEFKYNDVYYRMCREPLVLRGQINRHGGEDYSLRPASGHGYRAKS